MNNLGRFGPLLGTIYVSNLTCKFLVYAARNAEILTYHEITLQPIVKSLGWIEADPLVIWKAVEDCVEIVIKNLILLDINPDDIIAIGITNQRQTTVLWNKTNGVPLHNAIVWNDTRTSGITNELLAKTKNKKYYMQSMCGLPISTCFSAVKIKWLIDNIPAVKESIRNGSCAFGTLDSWIIWKLTGSKSNSIHMTDVSNASLTMMFNLRELKWDSKLCDYMNIPMQILPEVRTSSEIYGHVSTGPFTGIPIASCIGDQQSALLGQLCIKLNQATCTYDDGCYLLVNTGQEIIESDNGLISVVAFQLGPTAKPYYALEGSVANSGAAVEWLRDTLMLNTDLTSRDKKTKQILGGEGDAMTSSYSTTSSNTMLDLIDVHINNLNSDLVFVPAFSGLLAPYWDHEARGMIIGLNTDTTSHEITIAAYEAVCYQTRELLNALKKDLKIWPQMSKLTVGGEFSDNNYLLQMLANLCGITIERPQTTTPCCVGAMIAAGLAMNVVELVNAAAHYAAPLDTYRPTLNSNQRDIKYQRWRYGVEKCLNYKFEHDSRDMCVLMGLESDPQTLVDRVFPGGIFIVSSFAIYILAELLKRADNLT